MKKLYLIIAIAIIACISSSSTSFAQTITNISFFDSCNTVSNYSLQISTASTGLSYIVYWGDGSNETGTIAPTSTSAWKPHSYTSQGNYTVKTILLKNGTPIDSNTTSHRVLSCSYINLRFYSDNNNNCIQDNGEYYFAGLMKLEVDSAGVVIDTISGLSFISYKAQMPGGVYTFRPINQIFGASYNCFTSGVITITAPSTNNYSYTSHGIQCSSTTQFDLGVELTGRFRPVNTSNLAIRAYNNSCTPKNGVVTLHLSNKYTYKNANITPSSINGNIISWNLSNIDINNNRIIYLYLDTATTVTLNDTVCNYAIITPTSGDANTSNNTVNQCDEVRASWDPNDKHVLPFGNIASGQELTYTINFENLGNDTAFNIHILDTLSQHLDPNSFEMISSSHPATPTMLDHGSTKILKFDLADIYLPDSSSPEYNKGYVRFKINVKGNRAPNVKILNRAGIYFDINPVVLTNYAENTIAPVSVSEVLVEKDVNIYPNPTTGMLTVQTTNKQYSSVQVFNTIGQLMLEQAVTAKTIQINIQHLVPGIYYIQLKGEHGTVVEKIEKR